MKGEKLDNIPSGQATDILLLMGQNLRKFRQGVSMEQIDLARAAGVGRSTVQNAEKGKSIQLHKLVQICLALNISPGQLFIEKVPFATLEEVISKIVEEKIEKKMGEVMTKYGLGSE
jgi:transcriptional regulator with XRE-family HTH domain